jgi:DNA-binding MarR family transcriptional regulator
MAYLDSRRTFAKELPGADNVFQPPDLADYVDDAWDVRISVGDAPLEEAYYFTVEDPAAVHTTVGDLLKLALDPKQRPNLDIEEYPDLPFLQEELIQYRANERKGLLKLEYYINHDPSGRPVSLWQTAVDLLGVCTYHDRSHDYRVLDIVLVPVIPEANDYQLDQLRRQHGGTFLLMLLDYLLEQGVEPFAEFVASEPMAAYLGTLGGSAHRKFVDGMRAIEKEGLIAKQTGPDHGAGATVTLTEAGKEKLDELRAQFARDADYYDQFESVAIAPPALGVPGGFDVRVQMMEYDEVDIEATLLLQILGQDRDEWFAADRWAEAYESFLPFNVVTEALAYTTNFSAEVMDALKTLTGDAA